MFKSQPWTKIKWQKNGRNMFVLVSYFEDFYRPWHYWSFVCDNALCDRFGLMCDIYFLFPGSNSWWPLSEFGVIESLQHSRIVFNLFCLVEFPSSRPQLGNHLKAIFCHRKYKDSVEIVFLISTCDLWIMIKPTNPLSCFSESYTHQKRKRLEKSKGSFFK